MIALYVCRATKLVLQVEKSVKDVDRAKRDKRSRSAKEEREREVWARRASAEHAEHL